VLFLEVFFLANSSHLFQSQKKASVARPLGVKISRLETCSQLGNRITRNQEVAIFILN
jgi:hypothetical protein